MRLVSWNVNGIRRIVKDQERRGLHGFADILDNLGGDLICIQELKSERATFDPAFVDVDGWRSYFTFPVDKKAYSGVAIYLKDGYKPVSVETALCAPSYDRIGFDNDGSDASCIGGYPWQMSVQDQRTVDKEGRCLVLDLGGFVLFGLYCPAGAESDERVAYRQLFWRALDARLRNLVKAGREVVVMGDLNVLCSAIDSAEADPQEYHYDQLGPVSRTFRNLTNEGVSALDNSGSIMSTLVPMSGSKAIYKDLQRHFHPDREGMYTCWSVKLAARAGNHGSRIDYVLATTSLLPYCTAADIRPDIQGSDHCPVYADLELDKVEPSLLVTIADTDDVKETNYVSTQRKLTSLFAKAPKPTEQSTEPSLSQLKRKESSTTGDQEVTNPKPAKRNITSFFSQIAPTNTTSSANKTTAASSTTSKVGPTHPSSPSRSIATNTSPAASPAQSKPQRPPTQTPPTKSASQSSTPALAAKARVHERTDTIEQRFATAAAFQSLFTKPEVPTCSGHSLPAKLQKTKKKGPNEGREFWMCPVDLGNGQCDFWRWRKR